MARRGPQAKLREQAVELLARGDAEPPSIAQALGITEDALRELRKTRLFREAVLSRSHQLLDEAMPFVIARLIEKAEAGQPTHLKILIDYRMKLKELEAQSSSERWHVTWGSAPPPASPAAPEPEKDGEG